MDDAVALARNLADVDIRHPGAGQTVNVSEMPAAFVDQHRDGLPVQGIEAAFN
jgi:hypothetical protein